MSVGAHGLAVRSRRPLACAAGLVGLLGLAAACGGREPARVDAGADAWPALEQVEPSLPRGLAEGDLYPDGSPLGSRPWKLVDDCRVCVRGTLGLSCSRRAGCARPVCVLTDGTELAVGARLDTAWCHTCTCDAPGVLRCTARVDAACPAGRCAITVWGQAMDLAVGEERFTGECSRIECTADGAVHRDVCHDGCLTDTGAHVPLDHAALDRDGCAICTCTYGSWCCERRAACPATVDDPACPTAGTCTTPGGDVVRGGTRRDLGGDKTCTCVDGAWSACVCSGNPC